MTKWFKTLNDEEAQWSWRCIFAGFLKNGLLVEGTGIRRVRLMVEKGIRLLKGLFYVIVFMLLGNEVGEAYG